MRQVRDASLACLAVGHVFTNPEDVPQPNIDPVRQRVCTSLDLFDRVVAENGALLYTPATKEERPLGPPPPKAFVARLEAKGVTPLSVGRVIVATWEPNETAVLNAIRDLGLDLQIIFNKGAVMVLPNGINKASGLGAALEDLGLSAHNVVATGDAENDLAFMRTCGCAGAVGNALPAVKEAADLVTDAPRGAGVSEAIANWLDDEPRLLEAAIMRHSVVVGTRLDDGTEVRLRPDRGSVLITGTSGGGKTTLAKAMLERLADAEFQLCLFDPEGDYGAFDAVTFGDADTPVSPEAAVGAVRKLGTNVTVNLLRSVVEDRPDILASILPAVLDVRARYGRPHWILVDGGKGEKVPHLFTAADGSPVLAFAGLWDRWTDPASGDEVLSATIIVSGASAWMTPYHDRMPVLLGPEAFDGWLDGSLGPEALKPAAESTLREWIVSSRVNRTGVGDDDPTIVEPVEKAA